MTKLQTTALFGMIFISSFLLGAIVALMIYQAHEPDYTITQQQYNNYMSKCSNVNPLSQSEKLRILSIIASRL